jgi:NAD(P)-dependent dehydrogenase (short-subunit alcohol dehydrogenase family)
MRTWLVTGCSSGLGRAIAQECLEAGDRVVVTARRRAAIEPLAAGFPTLALPLELDVTEQASVDAAVAAAREWAGEIDVLVNNAAYGLYGAVEEVSDDEIRAVFETNLLGVARLLRAVLPHMRVRRSGTVVNIGSVAGIVGGPGNGFYAASKFGIEALSEAMHAELRPLGVRAILVDPSGIRTDFHGRSYKRARRVIADYEETAGKGIAANIGLDGRQAGDPRRIARTIRTLVSSEDPPLRMLVGASCVDRVRAKLTGMLEQLARWEKVSRAVDFDAPQP